MTASRGEWYVEVPGWTGNRTRSMKDAQEACGHLEVFLTRLRDVGAISEMPAIGVDLAEDGSYAVRANVHVAKDATLIPRSIHGIAVVVKQREMPHALETLDIGGEKLNPQTGRTAHVHGLSKAKKALKAFTGLFQKAVKIAITVTYGKEAAQGYGALLGALHADVSKMSGDDKAKWFNSASNAEIYLWALGLARSEVLKYEGVPTKKEEGNKEHMTNRALINALGVKSASFENLRTAMVPTLKMHLLIYCKHGKAENAHAIQATLILFYGGIDETWPMIKTVYDKRPKFDWKKPETAPGVAGWVDALVKALEPYRTVTEGADNPALDYA